MRPPLPVVAVWLAFAIAWVVPAGVLPDARESLTGSRVAAGWELCWAALETGSPVAVSSALSNVLMVISAIQLLRRPKMHPAWWLVASFACATILNSYWLWGGGEFDASGVSIGFWLWFGSFPAMAIVLAALRPRELQRSSRGVPKDGQPASSR